MLEADVGEQDDARVDHVRRVVAAPEPGLDDRRLDAPRGELGECSGRDRLELRRTDRLGVGPDALERRSKRGSSVSSRSGQPSTCGEM